MIKEKPLERFKILDRLDQERRVILFQHLGFIHCPIREHCPFFHNCVDNLVDEFLADKSPNQKNSTERKSLNVDRTLNLLIVGSEHLASDLLNDIRICTGSKGEYVYENQTYFLNYRIANGDMEAFKSIDVHSSGLICVYSNQQSFETLKDNLERTLLCNLELEDKFENLPIVLVYQPQDLKENEVDYLRNEGLRLSEMLHCDFIDHQQNQQKYVYDILNIVILSLRLTEMKSFDSYSSNHIDLRILVCMFCGDQYDIENIVNPLIAESINCKLSEHSIVIDVFIGDSKKRIEFILSSYHSINQYREDLIHGYIYFYSGKRRSSFANLSVLAVQNSNIPLQIIAVTESGGANAFFNSEICQFLITEGNSLADRCKGNFMTFSVDQYVKFAFYTPFLKNVWESKYEIENLHVEEPTTLDSGEGTLEHSVNQLPRPPPRHESYMLSSTMGTDGSGSENYEMLPTRSLNSLNEERDISLDEIYDDNEKPKLYHQSLDAPYIHCATDNLNVAICHACDIAPIRNCLGTVKKVVSFFRNCSKAGIILKQHIVESKTGAKQTRPLKFCETRWIEHLTSLNLFYDSIEFIAYALEEMDELKVKSDGVQRNELLAAIQTRQFIISLTVLKQIFGLTKSLSLNLQKEDCDLSDCIEYANDVHDEIKDMCTKEDETFREIFESATHIA